MFRRPKVALIATVVGLGILLALLPSRLNDQVKRLIGWSHLPIGGLADGVEQLGHRSRAYITPRSALQREIDRLREENRRVRLESFQTKAVYEENRQLRALVAWREQQPWTLRLGRVLVEDPSNWWRGLYLGVGSEQGVALNNPVLTDRGLVGKVIAVQANRCRVALLGDSNCRVAAELKGTGESGIINPSSQGVLNRRLVNLNNLLSDSPLKPGREVVTSGSGGVFPKGIPIGRLVDSQSYEFGLYSEARVRLDVDFERLDYAWVITGGGNQNGGAP